MYKPVTSVYIYLILIYQFPSHHIRVSYYYSISYTIVRSLADIIHWILYTHSQNSSQLVSYFKLIHNWFVVSKIIEANQGLAYGTFFEFLETYVYPIINHIWTMVDFSSGSGGLIEHGFSNSVFIIPGILTFALLGELSF